MTSFLLHPTLSQGFTKRIRIATDTCTESIDHVCHECTCESIHQLPNDKKHTTKNCSCGRIPLAINLCTTRNSIARRVHEVGGTDVAGEQSMTCASRESVPCCQFKRETGRWAVCQRKWLHDNECTIGWRRKRTRYSATKPVTNKDDRGYPRLWLWRIMWRTKTSAAVRDDGYNESSDEHQKTPACIRKMSTMKCSRILGIDFECSRLAGVTRLRGVRIRCQRPMLQEKIANWSLSRHQF